MSYSVTFVSNIVLVLVFVSKLLGWEVGSEELTTTVQVLFGFAAALGVFWGRVRAGGVNWLGLKI